MGVLQSVCVPVVHWILCLTGRALPVQAPVVRRLDNAIQQKNRYPVDKCQQNKPRYLLDNDLSSGNVIYLSKTPGLIFHKRVFLILFSRLAPSFTLRLMNCAPTVQTLIPNRTFLVCFGGISGEFGQAMVRILARRRRSKTPMARPNELDMLICSRRVPKRSEQRIAIYRTQIRPSDHHMVAISDR